MEHFIRKYENRKLYSKNESRYVTLVDIRKLIQEGNTVNVVNYLGQDITSEVLTKVLGKTENVPVLDLQTLITNN